MNSLSYYDRSKAPWGMEEVAQLKQEYDIELKNIISCADIHKRTPGCIAYKLKSMGLIVHNALSRGYTEYKTSKLYNDVVLAYKKEKEDKDKSREEKRIEKEKITAEKPTKDNIMREINILKADMAELKKDVKEILTLINSIYEFEEEK